MENNLINKSKFFAKYYGQRIQRYGKSPVLMNTFCDKEYIKDMHLELTPLSQITDEDAIEVAKIIEPELKTGTFKIMKTKPSGHTCIMKDGDWMCQVAITNERVLGNSHATDYLRQKGYALPYLDSSVEQQIEYGWVKLKTN